MQFVDRESECIEPMTIAAMNTGKPSRFLRMYGASTQLLKQIAIKYHPLVISSSCTERNWKQFKDIRTKKGKRLSTTSVEKLVIVQISRIVEEKDIDSVVI